MILLDLPTRLGLASGWGDLRLFKNHNACEGASTNPSRYADAQRPTRTRPRHTVSRQLSPQVPLPPLRRLPKSSPSPDVGSTAPITSTGEISSTFIYSTPIGLLSVPSVPRRRRARTRIGGNPRRLGPWARGEGSGGCVYVQLGASRGGVETLSGGERWGGTA